MNEEFFEELREKIMPYFEAGDGHGFDHVDRVYRLALNISEGEDVDLDVVKAAVLLHDVARKKEKEGRATGPGRYEICHAEEGAKIAKEILKSMNFPEEKISRVIHAIEVHRYSKGLKAGSREAEILQDADRLDALGAVIIIRMVEASVKFGQPIYDPSVPIKEEYDGTKSNLINHIYEKLLRIIPDSFNIPKARKIAKGRYDFVKEFAERYVGEVRGEI